MQSLTINTSTTAPIMWNGPVCQTCGARYLGAHSCTRGDLMRRIAALQALMPAEQPIARSCPCNPANGGSGICGCVLSGLRITC